MYTTAWVNLTLTIIFLYDHFCGSYNIRKRDLLKVSVHSEGSLLLVGNG